MSLLLFLTGTKSSNPNGVMMLRPVLALFTGTIEEHTTARTARAASNSELSINCMHNLRCVSRLRQMIQDFKPTNPWGDMVHPKKTGNKNTPTSHTRPALLLMSMETFCLPSGTSPHHIGCQGQNSCSRKTWQGLLSVLLQQKIQGLDVRPQIWWGGRGSSLVIRVRQPPWCGILGSKQDKPFSPLVALQQSSTTLTQLLR